MLNLQSIRVTILLSVDFRLHFNFYWHHLCNYFGVLKIKKLFFIIVRVYPITTINFQLLTLHVQLIYQNLLLFYYLIFFIFSENIHTHQFHLHVYQWIHFFHTYMQKIYYLLSFKNFRIYFSFCSHSISCFLNAFQLFSMSKLMTFLKSFFCYKFENEKYYYLKVIMINFFLFFLNVK